MESTPALLCARDPTIAKALMEGLLPEVDIIHFCRSGNTAMKELPALLEGESLQSQSRIGSNTGPEPPRRVPSLVIVESGVPFAEFEMLLGIDRASELIWLRADPAERKGAAPPSSDDIVDMIKTRLSQFGGNQGVKPSGKNVEIWTW